jgi:nitrous oxidase accessory protein
VLRTALLLVAFLAACATREPSAPSRAAGTAAPEGCGWLPAGGALQAAFDAAPDGARLCLAPGAHTGPARITRPLHLWGTRAAVVSGAGAGSVLVVEPGAIGTRLEGFTIDGTGTMFDQEGAAVLVRAEGVLVADLALRDVVFGVLVERSRGVTVRDTTIDGQLSPALGLRGDAIRLWETTDSVVERNRVRGARDLVAWYSSRNRIAGNEVVGGRYGTHLMYSHDCVIEDNVYDRDIVGVFIMYSHDVLVRRNRILNASGAAGMGIGLKDSGNIRLEDNVLAGDTVGLYLDSSPVQQTHANVISGNVFVDDEAAVVFLGGARGNTFRGNTFARNREHVRVEGKGDAQDARWEGNAWDDYAGYDLDGDGHGDVAYELRRLSTELAQDHPDLRILDGTPAMKLVDAAGRLMPLYEPRLILSDARPRVRRAHAP